MIRVGTPQEEDVHREQISELTHGVNNMLALYVEVHDGIFAHPWWRSLPIPGLFRAIPVDKYEIQISAVEQILREIEGHVRTLYKVATLPEKTYLDALHEYIIALLKAVTALGRVVVRLKHKTDGKQYDLSAYSADVATYRNAEKGYHALGEAMNHKWHAYRELPELDEPTDKRVGQDNSTIHEGCEVHILDAVHGLRVEKWTLGEQVNRETYARFKDPNGNLYLVVAYEKGKPNSMFVAKTAWDQVARRSAEIESEVSASFEKAKRDFGLT
jgi:hypothetical protein